MKNRYEVREDHAVIFLDRKDGSSLEAKVGLYDLDKAMSFNGKWCAMYSKSTGTFYAYGKDGGKSVMMHRFLTGAGDDQVVDHRNHDTLDNRRIENLRIATRSQNSQNRKGAQGVTKTGIRGVYLHSKTGKPFARIFVNGKTMHLGFFNSVELASEAVKKARAEHMPFSKEGSDA